MKQETLKKIVELADGFEYRIIGGGASDKIITPSGNQPAYFTVVKSKELYPLLLRRAVEGWNDKHFDSSNCKDSIGLDAGVILLMINDELENVYLSKQDYKKTSYLTCEEQSIEACLIELLE